MLKGILSFALTRRAIIMLGLLVFICAGLFAYAKLNIEAYPNPAPVILEITAQAPGLSAEEMEKYYTTPMEIGLYPTAGIANIRSTSFYGLSFVRVTFKYGVDYYAAYTQAALMLQHIGQRDAAQRIEESVRRTLAAGRGLTRDLGGDGNTATITEQLVANLR